MFVAGATGVLGRRIVRQFVARGHAVVGLVRDDAGDRTMRSLDGEPRRADLFNAESMRKAMDGCEVVLRATTSIPTRLRTSSRHWAMNDRIRREGTRALTAAAVDVGARAFLQESVVWVVRDPGGGLFDEGAPAADDPLLRSASTPNGLEAGPRLPEA